jgi:ribosomal protein S18 acetylase RimI-like enzyme
MSNEIEYVYGGMELFEETIPLRLKLLEYHSRLSRHFASCYSPARIEGTKPFLAECSGRGCLQIVLAKHAPTARNVGFCISTLKVENVGQIFAICVDDEFKNRGIGTALSARALAWLRSRHPKHLEVPILYENTRVRSFYERLGFMPETIILREVKTTDVSHPAENGTAPDDVPEDAARTLADPQH